MNEKGSVGQAAGPPMRWPPAAVSVNVQRTGRHCRDIGTHDSPSVFDACSESIWSLGDSAASAAVCAVLWLVEVSTNDDASSRYSPS